MSMWTEEETPDEADELPLWNGENKMVDDEPITNDQLDRDSVVSCILCLIVIPM